MRILLIISVLFMGCDNTQTNEEYSLIGTWAVNEFLDCASSIDSVCGDCIDRLEPNELQTDSGCQTDWCQATVIVSEQDFYYEYCGYMDMTLSECENTTLEWNYETSSCEVCSSLSIQINSFKEDELCSLFDTNCEVCHSVIFANEGNSATISLIQNELRCEDIDNCIYNYSEQECIDSGLIWESPSCTIMTLNKQ